MELDEFIKEVKKDIKAFLSIFKTKKYTFEELKKYFRSEDIQERHLALQKMAKTVNPEVIKIAMECLSEPPSVVTHTAEDILVEKGKDIIPRLLLAVGGNKETLRKAAVRVLDRMGEKLGKIILNALEKKKGAMKALLLTNDSRRIPPLVNALCAREDKIRHSAAEALGKIGDPRGVEGLVKALSDKNGWVKRAVIEALESMGNIVVDPIINSIDELAPEEKSEAIKVLGKIDDMSVKKKISRFLEDENSCVREAAIQALGKSENNEVKQKLLDSLKDTEPDVRRAAVTSLGEMTGKDFPAEIISLGEDTHWKVRVAVMEVLGGFENPSAFSLLTKALDDDDWHVRLAATESLGRFKNEFIVRIKKAVDDSVWIIRKTAADILGKPGFSDALDTLEKLLSDENVDVRVAAVKSIGRVGDARAVSRVMECLSESDAKIRASAVEALGKLKAKDSLGKVIKMLQDESYAVKSAALSALKEIEDKRSSNAVAGILSKEKGKLKTQAVETLGFVGDTNAISILLKLLEKEPHLAVEIVNALEKISDTSSLEALGEYLENLPENQVKQQVQKAMASILKSNEVLRDKMPSLVCSDCFHRLTEYRVKLPAGKESLYTACRNCRKSEVLENIDEVVVILDRIMDSEFEKKGNILFVNWFKINKPFDFDKIKITNADDFDVEKFVMIIRNRGDAMIQDRMKEIPVEIGSQVNISKNKLNLLEMSFKKILDGR